MISIIKIKSKMKKFAIEGWMTQELGLSGNELVCYAFLWDSTKGGKEVFTGGYTKVSAAINTTVPTAYNTLKKLAKRDIIDIDRGVSEIMVIDRELLKNRKI